MILLLTQIGHVLAETSMPAQVSSKRSASSVTPPVTSEKSSDPSHTSDEKSKSGSTSTLSDASEETTSSGSASSVSQSIASQKSSTTKQADTNKLQLFSTTATGGLPDAGTWQKDFKGVDNSNVLGIAGQFTIFAGEIDSATNHTVYGNFATSILKASQTNEIASRGISYLKDISGNLGQSVNFRGNTLILGELVHYEKRGNEPFINGLKVIPSPSDGFRQDQSGKQYIDMATELDRLSNNAKAIADFSKRIGPEDITGEWPVVINTSKVAATGNVKYITVTRSALTNTDWMSIKITGLEEGQRVVLTIDMSGIDSDGKLPMNFQLENDNPNTNILFNFYDYKKNMPYPGQILWGGNQGKNAQYTLLAPQATVTVTQQSFKGNIVAKKYINENMGEQSGNFPDIPVPSNKLPNPLISVPDVNFGTPVLRSKDTLTGQWQGKFDVLVQNGKELRINLKLKEPFTNSKTNKKADKVSWTLTRYDYQDGANTQGPLKVTDQNILNNNAEISYWGHRADNKGDVLADWQGNEKDRRFNFYKINIGNLNSIVDSGNYSTTLLWTIVNGPS